MTPEEVQAVGTHTRKSAAGMDSWEPAEIALLSPALFAKVAMLYNLIEAVADWPAGTNHARAAYLSKDPDKADDPLAYRVLLILPALYRVYGTIRLHSMQEWSDHWSLTEMYAGAGLHLQTTLGTKWPATLNYWTLRAVSI